MPCTAFKADNAETLAEIYNRLEEQYLYIHRTNTHTLANGQIAMFVFHGKTRQSTPETKQSLRAGIPGLKGAQ